MKELIFALLLVAGATSITWWIGTGHDPLEQINFARPHFSSLRLPI